MICLHLIALGLGSFGEIVITLWYIIYKCHKTYMYEKCSCKFLNIIALNIQLKLYSILWLLDTGDLLLSSWGCEACKEEDILAFSFISFWNCVILCYNISGQKSRHIYGSLLTLSRCWPREYISNRNERVLWTARNVYY
jgi:hypothetical protein